MPGRGAALAAAVALLCATAAEAQDTPLLRSSHTTDDVTFEGASADGLAVLFLTRSSIPGTGDTDGLVDLYLADRDRITLLSTDRRANLGGTDVKDAMGSDDLSTVFFTTAEDLPGHGDTDGLPDVYRWRAGAITRVTPSLPADQGYPPMSGFEPTLQAVSADGSRLFVTSAEDMTVPVEDGGVQNVYRWDETGGMQCLSPCSQAFAPRADSEFGAITPDGEWLAYTTAENGPGDFDALPDIHLTNGRTTVLVGANREQVVGGRGSELLKLASDGSALLLRTAENLVAADTDGLMDAYIFRDGTLTLITGSNPASSGGAAVRAALVSADFSRVLFDTAENMPGAGDTDGLSDVYRWQGGTITLVTRHRPEATGGRSAVLETMRADGGAFYFTTTESIPNTGDSDGNADIYRGLSGNLIGGITLLTPSAPNEGLTDWPDAPKLSADGRRLYFTTEEDIAAAGDDDDTADLYVVEEGALRLLGASRPGGSYSQMLTTTAQGQGVFFVSRDPLQPDDADAAWDIYSAGITVDPWPPEPVPAPVAPSPAAIDPGATSGAGATSATTTTKARPVRRCVLSGRGRARRVRCALRVPAGRRAAVLRRAGRVRARGTTRRRTAVVLRPKGALAPGRYRLVVRRGKRPPLVVAVRLVIRR